ncbi:hypothetical protein FRB95_013608 [Tulasnella sp. JGI-2019a]|nr:hypothetical protein FRB95_013608 [Tulasnella sp. JGI-2019a]
MRVFSRRYQASRFHSSHQHPSRILQITKLRSHLSGRVIQRQLLKEPSKSAPSSSPTSISSRPTSSTSSSTSPLPSQTTSSARLAPVSEDTPTSTREARSVTSHQKMVQTRSHIIPTTQTRPTTSWLPAPTSNHSGTPPTTQASGTSHPLSQTSRTVSSPLQSSSSGSFQPTPSSNVLDAQPNASSSDSTSKISSTTIAAIGVVFGCIVIMFCLLLRKRLREDREATEKRRRNAMETKDNSSFGGSEGGDLEKVAVDIKAAASSPSWVSGFMEQLHLPPAPVVSRWSRRGSGWEALASAGNSPVVDNGGFVHAAGHHHQHHPHPPPHVHFVDESNAYNNRYQNLQQPRSYYGYTSESSEYRDSDCCSTESEAIIATAARATIQSYLPASSTSRLPSNATSTTINPQSPPEIFASAKYSQPEMLPPRPSIINPSNSQTSAFTSTSYGGQDSDTSHYMISTPHESGGDVSDAWVTSDEATSAAILARAREPLRVANRANRHQSLMDSPGRGDRIPMIGEDGDIMTRGTRLRRSNTTADRYSTKADRGGNSWQPTNKAQHGPFSPKLSMGTVMLTSYGNRGSIVPPSVETPSVDHGEEWGDAEESGRDHRDDEDEYEDVVPHPSPRPPRFSAPGYGPPQLPLPPHPQVLFATPKLTVTSPSNGRLSEYELSESSSAEGAFIGLSQIAMMKSQPHYRSPTYSIYHMYDGDDEGKGGQLRLSFGMVKHGR